MTTKVENHCPACGADLPAEEMGPCPICGAVGRVIRIAIQDTVPTPIDSVSVKGTAEFRRGWDGQYHRMQRAFQRLWGVAPATSAFVAGDIEDGFIHFFQDAWHLKDWLRNDPTTRTRVTDIEQFINSSDPLKLVADLANGSKHLTLRDTRTGDKNTEMKKMSFAGDPTVGLTGSLFVESGGTTKDAVAAAREGVAEWDKYLAAKGLKP